jgi:hypothetical protein
MRLLRRCVILAWAAWLLSIGLLWVQHLMTVLHPPSLLFVVLVAITFCSSLTALVNGLWRLVRGPKRFGALAWLLVALLPVVSWAGLAQYAYRSGQRSNVPRNPAMVLMMRTGHSLMEAHAVYLYPHRLESLRLVMFYDDDLADPEGDLRVMDQHVANLESLTGLSLRAKIYWARGRLLGQSNLCCFGIALGSDRSPANELDRHELAHAVLNQHHSPSTEPPTLLSEGWAESQSTDSRDLAAQALEERRLLASLVKAPESDVDSELKRFADREGFDRLLRRVRESEGGAICYLRELTDPFWYHHDAGPVYSVGGAFVNFLLHKYGGERFVELYYACRPGTFGEECLRVFGTELDELEKEFWASLEAIIGRPR